MAERVESGLADPPRTPLDRPATVVCAHCGKERPAGRHGPLPARPYCSESCRVRLWEREKRNAGLPADSHEVLER